MRANGQSNPANSSLPVQIRGPKPKPPRAHRILKAISTGVFASCLTLFAANAQTLPFDQSWEALNFRGLSPTAYSFQGSALGINANSSSSVVYRAVPEAARSAEMASWTWSVDQSVPATNLAQKGGDDRNIAVYFVFTDPKTAARASRNPNMRRLMASRKSRTLIYVYGGEHAVGSFIPSPYMRGRGTTIIKRGAGTGSFDETVDLASDYQAAFGAVPGTLIGIAVSSDSDDTGVISSSTLGAITLAQ